MAESNSSSDSDPVLVTTSTAGIQPLADLQSEQETAQPADNDTTATARPPPLSRASTSGLDKCWICLSTPAEDDPEHPEKWRHPCKCTLMAHESCLLDWVADQESPKNKSNRSSSGDKILCPQCKSEIKVQRSTNALVQACRRIDRAYGQLVLPGLGASLLGTLWAGFWAYGHAAVWVVFGAEDASRIAQFALRNPRYDAAYSLIPLNLIFARTRYADWVLPSGTLFLIATELEKGMAIDWTMWPPLPTTVFASLPAIQQLYNLAYEKMFGTLNRRWITEVMPRREEGYEGQHQNIAEILNEQEQQIQAEGGGDYVVDVEVEIREDGQNEDGQPDDEADQVDVEQNGRVHRLLGDNELMDDTSSIGQMIIGALALPAVSAGMGELLKLGLPSSLTGVSNFYRGRPGLLSTKWGRTVVGGALFVVMKDALVLYCRWRLAQGHKKRRIMNYDKVNKDYILDD